MSRLHVSGAILVALLAVAATVMPATASVDVVDYVSWRWPGPGPRGIGLIDTVPSTTGTFVELVGLEPALSYRVVASERGCNRTHRPVDEVISEQVTADANGAAFVDAPLNGAVDPRDIKSLRLFLGSSQTDCSKPQSYQVGSGPDGPPQEQMSLNIFSGAGGVYGMVTEPRPTRARRPSAMCCTVLRPTPATDSSAEVRSARATQAGQGGVSPHIHVQRPRNRIQRAHLEILQLHPGVGDAGRDRPRDSC